MAKMVLFNTGWMRSYQGLRPDDQIVNGGEHVVKYKTGWEIHNFRSVRGHCYGFAQTNRATSLAIERIGGNKEDETLDGVTVVFTATRPEGKRVVVGWYKNARIWRFPVLRVGHGFDEEFKYFARARSADAHLLPVDQRAFEVPLARDNPWGVGQSNVRYLDEPKAKPFLKSLTEYMSRPMSLARESMRRHRGHGWGGDPQDRVRVEKAAIDVVVNHYERQGFECNSVERDRVGWDLEVSFGALQFLVEVKGCSGPEVIAELTPNEYAQMKANLATYRLAIVTSALHKSKARLTLLAHNLADGRWIDESGRAADIEDRIGARVELSA